MGFGGADDEGSDSGGAAAEAGGGAPAGEGAVLWAPFPGGVADEPASELHNPFQGGSSHNPFAFE